MGLAPVERRSVADDVADQLLDRIVGGELAPGDVLPGERALADALGVSRPAVREGLRRLAAGGLVAIRQGAGTTVTDFRRHAGMDLLPRLLLREDEVDLAVAEDLFTARTSIGPVVAAEAARRADPDAVAALRAGLGALLAIDPDDAAEARQRAALALWDQVVDASCNVAYRLLFNAFRSTYEPVLDLLVLVLDTEVRNDDGYRALVEAVAAGDPSAASDAAIAVLAVGQEAAEQTIAALRDHRERVAALGPPPL